MRRIQSLIRIALPLCLLALVAMPLNAAIVDPDDGAHVGIRVYEGVDPENMAEILRVTSERFVPIISAADGFMAYFLLPEGDTLAAINIFKTAEQANAANAAAAGFVVDAFAPLLPVTPNITVGALNIFYIAPLDDAVAMDDDMDEAADDDDESHSEDDEGDDHDMDADTASLYAALRIYTGYDGADHSANLLRTNSILLPLQQRLDGFFGYIVTYDGAETLAAVSIFDSEESARKANEEAAAFTAEFFADILPDGPMTVTGSLGIAALAGIEDGANLIDLEAMDADDGDDDMDGDSEHADDDDGEGEDEDQP